MKPSQPSLLQTYAPQLAVSDTVPASYISDHFTVGIYCAIVSLP